MGNRVKLRNIAGGNAFNFQLIFLLCGLFKLSLPQNIYRIPPSFIALPPREIIYSQGRPFKVPCAASGHPQPRLEWYLNGERLVVSRTGLSSSTRWTAEERYDIDESKQSVLWDLTDLFASGRFQSGWLYCVAVNPVGRAISPPVWSKFAQIDESKPCETRTFTLRDQPFLRLNCTIPESIPPATVRWMYRQPKGFMGFIHENRTFAMDDEGNLLIATAGLPRSTTLYLFCSASNSILRTMRTDCDNVIQVKRGLTQGLQSFSGPFIMARSPSKQIRLLNETVELRCIISPFPGTEIQWVWQSSKFDIALEWKNGRWSTKYNDVLPNDFKVEVKNEGTLLSIERLGFEHAGVYTCQSVSKVGHLLKPVLATFELIVESIPTFKFMPSDTTVPIGDSAQLRCEPNEIGVSKIEVKWHMNGEPIEHYLDGNRKRLSGNTLILNNLGLQDSAVFQCNISNQYGFQFANAYVNVWNSPPAIIRGPSNEIIIAEGQKTIIPCKIVGAPTPRIYWTRDGSVTASDEIGRDFGKRVILSDGSLEIKKVTLADSGMYKCVVSNRFGGSSASGRLVVRRSTRITSGPLWVGRYALQKTTENGTIITSIGNEVTLFCRAETDPLELSKLLIKWQWLPLAKLPNSQLDREADSANGYSELPSDAIRETQRKISRSSIESSLTLLKPLPLHSGTYKCQAISSLDNDSRNVDVIIQGPPGSPIDISIDCTQAAKRGTALLSWTSGSENNAPITDVQIEYMVGYIRPLAKSPSEISLSNGLHTSLDSRAIFEALNASLMRNEWQVLKHSLVSGDRYSSALWKIDKGNTAVVNLTGRVALIPIYPDVAYQFRLRLINLVGVSNPSPLAPGLNEEEQTRCLLKPQAPTVNPDDLEIYGNVPNTLTVTWKPIPPIRHNGPGLRYHLNLKCLDCEQSLQSSGALNETVINNWNQSQIVFTKLPLYDIFSKQLPIEIFKQYEVSLFASNALGLSKADPTISKGWSAEYPPTIAPHKLRATRVDSSTAELAWDWPTTDSIAVNGFFVGLRLEWCLAEKDQMCDRYKVTQDVRIAEPSKELYPHLRINPSESDSRTSKDFPHPNVTDNRLLKSNFLSYSQHRQAVLKDLPGLSHLRVWVRVLNIQYEGPSSEILIIHTKEGVPEEVSEFTHSFAGVNYVEVAWAKPTQTNGILTGYLIDVLSDKEDCVKKAEGCEFSLYEKKISDPDQMATRIGGLKISTSYTLRISALTAVGPGKPRELKVHTAKLKPAKSPAEFVVSPVYGSTNTLNVSLIRPLEASNTLNDENRHPLLQRDDALLEPGSSSLIKNTGPDGLRAFLVQFKRLQDEHWEETEKEFDKVWQIVGNLIPGEEYDMRVILAQSPSVSYVSPVRMLRVPRPGEIGFGLSGGVSTTLRENSQGSIGSGGVFGDASLVLKIFVPLAVTLFLIALIFTSVCCLRGPMFRQPMPRRLRTPKPSPSSLVAQRLNGCRVADKNFTSKKPQQYGHSDNVLKEYTEKETVIYMPMGMATECSTPNLDRKGVLKDSGPLKGWFDTSGMNQCRQQDHVQQPSTSTFAPTRCLSPSFTLVPPMENPTPWQRATITKETFPSDRPS